MKFVRPTNTIEVCKMCCIDDGMSIKQYKGDNLLECLSKITGEDYDDLLLADITIEDIIEALSANDYILYIKDVTNRDYIYISDTCSIENARKCNDYEWR